MNFLILLCFIFTGFVRQSEEQAYYSLAWSNDGQMIAVVSATGVRLFDAETRQPEVLPFEDFTAVDVAFSPDDRLLTITDSTGAIHLWDIEENQFHTTLPGHPGKVVWIDFSPDGKTLLSTAHGELRLWDAETGAEIRSVEFPTCPPDETGYFYCLPLSAAFSPDGSTIATLVMNSDHILLWQLWDTETMQEIQQTTLEYASRAIISDVVFSPDGKSVLSGQEIYLRLWDIESNTLREVEQVDAITDEKYDLGHQWGVSVVAFSPQGNRFASGGYQDGTIQIYEAAKETAYFQDAISSIFGLAFSPDGALLASVNEAGEFQLWDAATGELLHTHKTQL